MASTSGTSPALQNKGSLITYKCEGKDHFLNYLWAAEGHGVFEPNFGKVDVTPEEAKIHNECLDKALIKGLEETCEVGQWGTFYLHKDENGYQVRTWTGKQVSETVSRQGRKLAFTRKGRTFEGNIRTQDDVFNFKRVA